MRYHKNKDIIHKDTKYNYNLYYYMTTIYEYTEYIKYIRMIGKMYYIYYNPMTYITYNYILTKNNLYKLKKLKKYLSHNKVLKRDLNLPVIDNDLIKHV